MTDGTKESNTILVVEDEAPLRESLRWMLEDEGWPVEAAADGQEALDIAQRVRPALVVLDMVLPILNGDAVAAGLRRLYRDAVPILLITADGRAATKARRVGAFGYLTKPFDFDQLLSAVRRGVTGAE